MDKVYILWCGYKKSDLTMVGTVYSTRGKVFKFAGEYITKLFGKDAWKNRETLPCDEWWITHKGKKYYFTIVWYKVI